MQDLEERFNEIEDMLNKSIIKMRFPEVTKGLFKKRKGKRVFGVFTRNNQKRAILYSYMLESVAVETNLEDGEYVFEEGNWVNERFEPYLVSVMEIADLLAVLVQKAIENAELKLDRISKLLRDKRLEEV